MSRPFSPTSERSRSKATVTWSVTPPLLSNLQSELSQVVSEDAVSEKGSSTWKVRVQDGRGPTTLQLPGTEDTVKEMKAQKSGSEKSVARRSSLASDRSDYSARDDIGGEQVDVNHLLENDVGKALRIQSDRGRSNSKEFENFLVDLGFEVTEESRPNNRRSFMGSESRKSAGDGRDGDADREYETFLVQELFGPPTSHSLVHPRHLALTRVVQTIFTLDQDVPRLQVLPSAATMQLGGSGTLLFTFQLYIALPARRIIKSSFFTSFYMALTVYALFGMDLYDAIGNSDQELPFVIVNTVVFFFFLIELLLYSVGKNGYLCTMEFLMDAIALASVFTDTWFIQVEVLRDETAGVMRMGRSSRVARLARLARIARLTRMLVAGVTCSKTRKRDVAKLSLMRRLWRVFLFLDPDRVGHITAFDMKCFYMVVMKNHPCFKNFPRSRVSDLEPDSRWFSKGSQRVFLTWEEFASDFLGTRAGRRLLQEHAKEVDADAGAWTLTRKVSDSSALRISVVVLVLLGVITFFDTNPGSHVRDAAPSGLAQLEFISRRELSRGHLQDATGVICDSIDVFRQSYDLIYLVLDGYLRWEDGRCLQGNVTIASASQSGRIHQLIQDFKFRTGDYYIPCVPDWEDCLAHDYITSMSLVDHRTHNRESAWRVLLSTTLVIILLVIFIAVMSAKMGEFAKTMLSPLHALLEDMHVLSNLDLANVDEDMPPVGIEPEGIAQELAGLQDNSRSLRNAIRSWSKFVPPMVVQRLFTAGLEAQIGVAQITATILFCDLIGFEEACVGLEPEEVLLVLNQALGTISEAISRNQGTLLEFIGDEVLAVFNAPNKVKYHVFAGVQSALDIHAAAKGLPEFESKGGKTMQIRCRCGVHSGQMLAGNIGSQVRMKYGLLGDSINLTARLKMLNSRYNTQTLISDAVLTDEYCMTRVAIRPVDIVAVKGKKKPTVVYEAFPKDQEAVCEASTKHKEAFRLYQDRNFLEAEALLGGVVQLLGESDGPASILKARCARYAKDPPPVDWDGVERLNAKSFQPG